MTIESTSRVRTIAAEHPMATRVFHRHGIDFCCGGAASLADVCADQGLNLECVLREIDKELRKNVESVVRWDLAPLPDLIEHILTTYHESLREELPRLDAMARKVN